MRAGDRVTAAGRRALPLLWVSSAYAAITVVMTWPLVTVLGRDIPTDLGDPAFVAGVMAWAAEHWLQLFTGDLGAAARFWHAPIFAPEPLATAYSEHFALQALLTLPVYALTRNPVLCYNLALLTTFVLGALGMFLLVREVAGSSERAAAAAFVAGLAFAFAPYRIATLGHLQLLSAQWMPFVLLGLHRYIRSRNTDALLGASAAWWAQNLSSGYYLLFFAPFVAVHAVVQMWTARLLTSLSVWRDIGVAAAVTMAASLPFMLPYVERGGGVRQASEVIWFSADLYAWLTASPLLHVWGRLQTLPKAEGFLFPGLTIVALAAWGAWRGGRHSPSARVFGVTAAALSFWLALGPQVQADTQPVAWPSLYRWFFEYLPGYDAARVPARFATITMLALALLAGLALTDLAGRRGGRVLAAACGLLILIESAAFPLPTNGTWSSAPSELVPPPPRVTSLADGPAVYRYLADVEPQAIVAHFPFGVPEREIQYGYYAMLHGRRTVNGYSGGFPPSYAVRLEVLRHPLVNPQAALDMLALDGVTHVIVDRAAYVDARTGERLVAMLTNAGWRLVASFGEQDVIGR